MRQGPHLLRLHSDECVVQRRQRVLVCRPFEELPGFGIVAFARMGQAETIEGIRVPVDCLGSTPRLPGDSLLQVGKELPGARALRARL